MVEWNQCRFLFYDTIFKHFGSLRYFGGVCNVVLMVAESVYRPGTFMYLYTYSTKLAKIRYKIGVVKFDCYTAGIWGNIEIVGWLCGGCSVLILLLLLLVNVDRVWGGQLAILKIYGTKLRWRLMRSSNQALLFDTVEHFWTILH